MSALQNFVFFAITMAIAFGFQAYRNLTIPLPKPELGKFLQNTKNPQTLIIKTFKIWTSTGGQATLRPTSKINLSSLSRFPIPRRWEARTKLIKKLFEDSRRRLTSWWTDSKILKLQPIPSKWQLSSTVSIRSNSAAFWITGKTIIYQSGVNAKPFWTNFRNSQLKFKGKFSFLHQRLLATFHKFGFRLNIHFIHAKPTATAGATVHKLILLVSVELTNWTQNQ